MRYLYPIILFIAGCGTNLNDGQANLAEFVEGNAFQSSKEKGGLTLTFTRNKKVEVTRTIKGPIDDLISAEYFSWKIKDGVLLVFNDDPKKATANQTEGMGFVMSDDQNALLQKYAIFFDIKTGEITKHPLPESRQLKFHQIPPM